jgi:hypothetical protein
MKKIPQILLILQILAQTMSCASAKPASAQRIWNGSADTKWYNDSQNEFTITTPEQLAGLAKLVNKGTNVVGKTVKLGANIMLNDTANWQNWAEKAPRNKWKPIGFSEYKYYGHVGHLTISDNIDNYFWGTFDGNGFAVSGIYVNSGQRTGLFGYVKAPDIGGGIKNLGVTASYIKGSSYVGGLIGHNEGPIVNCYSTAWVVGGSDVGGLAGRFYGKIIDSYSTGIVMGRESIGGLVGRGSGMISRSYSTSNVTGERKVGGLVGDGIAAISSSYSTGSVTGKEEIGGLVGYSYNGVVSSSYSIGKVVGEKNAGGLVGLIENEGRITSSYYDKETSGQSDKGKGEGKSTAEMKQRLTFANWGFDFNWGIDGKINYGYPHLHDIKDDFIITTAEQMVAFADLVNTGIDFSGKTVRLGANIMLNDTANWHDWENNPPANKWVPIGVRTKWKGTFDGEGFVLSGIYINDDRIIQGLFGHIDSSGSVKNLGVAASYIKGRRIVGGFAVVNDGEISNSYSMAWVMGKEDVGGLAVTNSGVITNSYFAGNVTGEEYAGGLVVINSGVITNSYFAGNVPGKRIVGGLVAINEGGEITSSYYDKEISGQSDIGKGEGKTTEEMKEATTYKGWDFDKVWGISDDVNGGYPYLRK